MIVSWRYTAAAAAALLAFGAAGAAGAQACCAPPTGPIIGIPSVGAGAPSIGVGPTVFGAPNFGAGGVVIGAPTYHNPAGHAPDPGPGPGCGGAGGCGPIGVHPIAFPGVNVTPPNINIATPTIHVNTGGVVVGGTTFIGGTTLVGGGGGGFVTQQFIGGGGGGYFPAPPPAAGMVELGMSGEESQTISESATEMVTETMVIRASCIDDKGAPHPAARVTSVRDIASGFDGEVFRCMAGTQMEVTIGRWVNGQAVWDGGRTLSCAKGEALVYRVGQIVCAPASRQAGCYERSLLRRHGPGIKVVTLTTQQQVQRTRTVQAERREVRGIFLDGGVGVGLN